MQPRDSSRDNARHDDSRIDSSTTSVFDTAPVPLGDDDSEITYLWAVSENIKATGLWKHGLGYEYPVYQNTRGKAVFNSAVPGSGTSEWVQPSNAFWEMMTAYANGADEIKVEEAEWYEVEFLEALDGVLRTSDQSEIPSEIGQLLSYAEEVTAGE